MRILLIAPSLDPATYKGLGRYSKEIYERLKHYARVDILTKAREDDKVLSTHLEIPLKLLRASGYDLVHALSPEMGIYTPYLFPRTAVTFHDLIPLTAFRQLNFKYSFLTPMYTKLTWEAAARATLIIANSTQTKQELVRILGVDPRRIRTIPLGVDERFTVSEKSKRHTKKPTIGFFGNFTQRKRADLAIRAFQRIRRRIDARLILAGGPIKTAYQRHFHISAMVKNVPNVTVRQHIRDENVAALYKSFNLMLFPSEYEGFGLPILEAQRCGVPVLTMRRAMIPSEVAMETVKCNDVNNMASKAIKLLIDDRERRRISERGIRYASTFTWKRTIASTLKAYDEILSKA